MTRLSVYSAGLGATVIATVMTLTAIFIPHWLTWTVTLPSGDKIRHTYGLHRRCSSLSAEPCIRFPEPEDCLGDERYFCSMWRSVGFLMSFTACIELVGIVAFLVVLIGGRAKREGGWKVLGSILLVIAALQCAAMAIVAYLFDNDDRFFVGWRLDTSWILCTTSWALIFVTAAGLALSAWILPSEGGYELIPNPNEYGGYS